MPCLVSSAHCLLLGNQERERERKTSMAAALISDCKDDVRKISTPIIDAFHSPSWKNNVSCKSDEAVWGKERTEREQLKTRMMGVAVLRMTPMMKDTLIYSTAPDTETKNLSVSLSCSLCSSCWKENLFLISIFSCFAVKKKVIY